jgi:NADH-quinone oxidoreductase subunit G
VASDLVTLTIDGKEVTVPKGTLIIRAAEQLGIEIPRFCDHPYLDPIGACRQCYVEVEGQRKLMTSCTTPVGPDMVVKTQNTSDQAQKAQVGNLEFLLLNHPLDCPICDRGGECPLQDQALAFGPGESRYIEPKRTYQKPLDLSPLVALDRERCVLCARCTRFCDQVSGDRFIELFDRGAAEQVAIAPGEDFRSPFSGNTIQICPVGALTARSYRFAARPFDLQHGDTVCPHCASGCSMRADLRRGAVVRHLARDNADVNEEWLCDKGRFAFRFPDAEDRVKTPLLRERGLEPAAFDEVFAAIGRWSSSGRIGFLTGGRLCDEDAYALSKLARTAFGTNDLDHRRYGSTHVPLEVEAEAAAGEPVTYRDVEQAGAIVVVGLDAEQELPILHLRIRKAARRGANVVVIHARRTRLWDVAHHVLCRPGEEADVLERLSAAAGDFGGERRIPGGDPEIDRAIDALDHGGERTIVIAGARLAESPDALRWATSLARGVGGRFTFVSRRAGDRGALRAGVHPRLLPGGRGVDDESERAEVESVWGASVPSSPGRDARAILEAAAQREIDVLYLIGVDPLTDFPDAKLARHALSNVEYKVVQDIRGGSLMPFADAVLPAAAFLERDGHFTTWEGRGQRLKRVRGPVGLARPDWEILQELSDVLGKDLGFDSIDDVHEEMGRLLGTREPPPGGRFAASTRAAPAALASDPPVNGSLEPSEGELLLFTYPLLVDEGRLNDNADELKNALQDPAFVEIHTDEAERLGIEEGQTVRLTTEAGVASLPARVTPHVAPGSAFVPFNNSGFRANTLLSGTFITTVAIEPANGG